MRANARYKSFASAGSVALGLALLCSVSGLIAQQTPVGRSGALRGRVVDALSNRPLKNVIVTVHHQESSRRHNLLTGPDGLFVDHNLEPGTYLLSAALPGYFEGASGQRRANGTRMPVTVGDGSDARRTEITIRLWPHASIAGAVRDAEGGPLGRVAVRVVSTHSASAERPVVSFEAMTDDAGEYVVSSLMAGTYLVAVVPQYGTRDLAATPDPARPDGVRRPQSINGSLSADGRFEITVFGVPLLPLAANGRPLGYPMTFAPASRTLEGAQPVSLAPGEAREHVDIELQPTAGMQVSGIVRSPSGPAARMLLRLTAQGGASWIAATSSSAPDGAFVFANVPLGRYTLEALSPPPALLSRGDPEGLFASMPVSVEREGDLANLMVLLRPGVRVSGRYIFDLPLPPPAVRGGVMAYLDPVAGERLVPVPPGVPQTGPPDGFVLSGVQPGRFLVGASGLPAGWMVKSVFAGGRDVTFEPLVVGGTDISDLEITVTNRISAIEGAVKNSQNALTDIASVVVFPADRRLWISGTRGIHHIRSLRTTGRYQFDGLPAGEYFIIACDDVVMGEWPDPALLATLATGATRVVLADAERKVVDLVVRSR